MTANAPPPITKNWIALEIVNHTGRNCPFFLHLHVESKASLSLTRHLDQQNQHEKLVLSLRLQEVDLGDKSRMESTRIIENATV